MKQANLQQEKKARRVARVRAKIHGTSARPRLTVYRSLAHIEAQIIDDTVGKTLVSCRDLDLEAALISGKKKVEVSHLVGKTIAERAKAKGITHVVFDRRDKRYHGRVQAIAEGAREGGLVF